MPLGLILAGVAAAVGLGISAKGLSDQKKANKKANKQVTAATKVATEQGVEISKVTIALERQRKLQMSLEAMRHRREIIRHMVSARAQALSNATLAGAGDSSGLFGGLAQESAEGTSQLSGVYTNEDIGKKIFDYNAEIAALGGKLNESNAQIGLVQARGAAKNQEAQGLFNMGSSVTGSATTFGRVGGSLLGK